MQTELLECIKKKLSVQGFHDQGLRHSVLPCRGLRIGRILAFSSPLSPSAGKNSSMLVSGTFALLSKYCCAEIKMLALLNLQWCLSCCNKLRETHLLSAVQRGPTPVVTSVHGCTVRYENAHYVSMASVAMKARRSELTTAYRESLLKRCGSILHYYVRQFPGI